jgi:DnaJ-domain-containing protein 1
VGIFDRLGDVIKSYLNDEDGRPRSRGGDPDMEEAEAELESFLRGGGARAGGRGGGAETGGRDWDRGRSAEKGRRADEGRRTGGPATPPEELRPDFAELGLPFGAGSEECKAAYRRLLKLHHPDRHAGHEGNRKKATEKSARINAAYDRIEKWRAGKS